MRLYVLCFSHIWGAIEGECYYAGAPYWDGLDYWDDFSTEKALQDIPFRMTSTELNVSYRDGLAIIVF